METYRLTSKLNDNEREYLIQTTNDGNLGSVLTTVVIDGVPAETVTSPHPSDINPEEVLSFVKMTHGEKKDEVERLLKALRAAISSHDVQKMFHLGTAFLYKGFYHEARELFVNCINLNHTHHQAYNFLSTTQLALGRFDEAESAAHTAVQERPGYADYRNNYAEALLANNKIKEAIRQLDRAIEINMYYSDAYFNQGLAHLLAAVNIPEKERPSGAVRKIADFFHRASLTYANFQSENYDAGMRALRNGDLVNALSVFTKIREEKKDRHRSEFASFYMKFVLYPEWVSEKAVSDRISFLKSELEKNPSYVDLHAELSQCYLEQARLAWRDGIEQLRLTSEINPSLNKIAAAKEQCEQVYSYISRALRFLNERG
jgi:tetratricopeptide (TPR) repeat protein